MDTGKARGRKRFFPDIFGYRPFALMWTQRLLANVAIMMQSVAIGWQVYTVARQTHSIGESSFFLGMIGLVQFVPFFIFSLLAGETVDRYDRRKILMAGIAGQIFCSVVLIVLGLSSAPSFLLLFAVAALFNAARAFIMPASISIVPMLVPPEILPKAVAWSSLGAQFGKTVGPWIGGGLCVFSPAVAYIAGGVLFVIALICIFLIDAETKPQNKTGSRSAMIREGLLYLWSDKIVFGAISLDLLAVFLGGVTALLPVYARDVLQVGADGFGLLRSAPALGGIIVLSILSFMPVRRRAGVWMLSAIAVYGMATLVFAVSHMLWLSMGALVILGAADSVSLFVRQTLVQIVTPDHMRGRVSAVSSMFMSASNELGEFESGVAARLLGPVGAAIFGGVGSIIVAGVWAKLFPALRKSDHLVPNQPEP